MFLSLFVLTRREASMANDAKSFCLWVTLSAHNQSPSISTALTRSQIKRGPNRNTNVHKASNVRFPHFYGVTDCSLYYISHQQCGDRVDELKNKVSSLCVLLSIYGKMRSATHTRASFAPCCDIWYRRRLRGNCPFRASPGPPVGFFISSSESSNDLVSIHSRGCARQKTCARQPTSQGQVYITVGHIKK